MTASATGRHLSVRGVADRFGVTPHIVLGWIARGELRAVNVAASLASRRPTWRIAEDAIRDFERLRSPRATASKPAAKGKAKEGICFY